MADVNGIADLANPTLNLSPDEKRLFGQLFHAADTENVGVVTGDVAVKFFEKSRLEPRVLGEIWQIADTENRGFLTPAGFGLVLRLIGQVQAGLEPSAELAYRRGPLPKFEGFNAPALPAAPALAALQPQSSGGPIRVPPLTPEKVAEYSSLFEKSGAQNGVLAGDQAKQIFERARLPNDVLGRIWNLADTEQRGALGATEFIIAMHLLASFKGGAMRAIPSILPPGLYDAAARRVHPVRPQYSGAAVSPAIPRQFSGSGVPRTQSPLARPASGAPLQAAQPTGGEWAINPRDKTQFDSVFASLDKANRGIITGEEAVGFFSNSRLPEEVLAQIWDLADINSEGHLNRDEFAVAMYLIRQQRSNPQGLPAVLPPGLIPPSMRQQIRPPAQPTAPAFVTPATKSAADDLFGLDALSSAPPAPAPASAGTPTSAAATNATGATATSSPAASQSSPATSTFKPFVPSSSFGQTIMTTQATGGSSSSNVPPARAVTLPAPSAADDLLGDNDPEVSKKLTAETSELANLSNQVGTLSTQMQEVKSKRASTEQELSTATTQKREFESRLSQLRAVYEQEVKEVKGLAERLAASRNETRKIQQDLALIEGTYGDLQTQHRQAAEALEADLRENANLKERMRLVNTDISQLRPQLDKLRSEARQQKGLVAINKKQLATNESDREKLRGEIDVATQEVQAAQEAVREAAQEAPRPAPREPTRGMSSASLVHSPAPVASPAPSAASQSTNPFFRRNTASESGGPPVTLTPPVAPAPPFESHSSFDQVFGPPFAAAVPEVAATSPAKEAEPRALSAGPAREMVTPTSSPAPSSRYDSPRPTEPPPPPESRQVTSTQLPLLQRGDSVTSSVQVATPGSRYESHTSTEAATPNHQIGSARDTPRQEHEEQAGALATPSPALDATSGASVGEANPPAAGSTTSERSLSNNLDDGHAAAAASDARSETPLGASSDPFAPPSHLPKTATATKEDFDAAFAGFEPPRGPQEAQPSGGSPVEGVAGAGAGVPKSSSEFPPIEEFGNDEESDTGDEHGFDDNFTTPSPPHTRRTTAAAPIDTVLSGADTREGVTRSDTFGSRPAPMASEMSFIGQPPPASAQVSPPTYDQTVGAASREGNVHGDSSSFPAEFTGLLPARPDAQSPSGSASNAASFGPSNTTKVLPPTVPSTFPTSPPLSNTPLSTAPSDTYQSAVEQGSVGIGPSPISTQGPPGHKAAFDADFDRDFADLAEAKEADGRGEEDFGVASHPEGLDEFNPVFDSPAPSKTNTMISQPTSLSMAPTDSFNEFEPNHGGSSQITNGSKAPAQPAAPLSHDWDAIFAGLDNPNGTTPTATSQPGLPPKEPFETTSGSSASKPPLGRALTDGTEHDDPILKRLTGLGYARDVALAALERYDYNIDKAADHLLGTVQR
ncbi:MAG: hypothetical protein M1838_000054 [Thelocarpon superellum]|nr:MAG: hypothetical protein M1838_000054 [Thelocarpon superellum]